MNSTNTDPKSVRTSNASNFTGINENPTLNNTLFPPPNVPRKSFSELAKIAENQTKQPNNTQTQIFDADAFVKNAFLESPPQTTDLATRFPTHTLLAGGKSGAKVYKVTGKPNGHPEGTYILKLYHARHPSVYVENDLDLSYLSKLVFALSPSDGPNYEKAMKVLESIDPSVMHGYLIEAIQIMMGNDAASATPEFIQTLLKQNLSASISALTALAETTIHYFRALKDIEVCMQLQNTPEKIAPTLYEYGFIDKDPFDPSSHEGITCYNVTEFIKGVDFGKFSTLLHPTKCNSSSNTCDAPRSLQAYLAASLLFRVAHFMSLFRNHFRRYKEYVGCHRDLHPGNIQILQKPADQSWVSYWTQTEMVRVNGQTYQLIGPKITLIDFDLSISENPLINRSFECKRQGNPALKALGVQDFIGASFFFMKSHAKTWQPHTTAIRKMQALAKTTTDADVFAWKVIFMTLLGDIPACNNFEKCISATRQFQAMKNTNESIAWINNEIEGYRTTKNFAIGGRVTKKRRRIRKHKTRKH